MLSDGFDGSTKGEVSHGAIKYVRGKDGLAFLDVYRDNPEGGKIRANVVTYDNENAEYLHPNSGTVVLWVEPSRDPVESPEQHGLFTAYALDGTSKWDILVYKASLVAVRDYSPCIRATNEIQHNFQVGHWYKLTLTWRGESTKLFVDDVEMGSFKPVGQDVFPPYRDFIAVGDDLFATDNLEVSTETIIPITETALGHAQTIACPNLSQLLAESPQEVYKDISIHSFPNETTRAKLRSFLDLLPVDVVTAIAHIVLVDDQRYSLSYGNASGNFRFAGKAMFLRKSLFDSPEKLEERAKTFSHEAGHAWIYASGLNYGGPSGNWRRQEWASISGIAAYVGECKIPDAFVLTNGFLTAYGSTMPDEDLAEWVGITYDLYLKGETFSALLEPSSTKYDERNRKKIDFLVEKGFIGRDIYDAVTTVRKNARFYPQFNS